MNDPFWSPGMTLEDVERLVILKALAFYRGNKTQTAGSLGIAIRTLDSKLEKYDDEQRNRDEALARLRAGEADFLHRQRGPARDITGAVIDEGATETKGQERHDGSTSGVRLEPAPQASAQQAVPVPQRAQVQTVLPKHAPQGSSRRHR